MVDFSELIEKVLIGGVSALGAGALGYVVAAFTLKKSLEKRVADAKEAILLHIENDKKAFMTHIAEENVRDSVAREAKIEAVKREAKEKVDKLEKELDGFVEGQVGQWNEMNRTLGHIEGTLGSLSPHPPPPRYPTPPPRARR